MSATILANALSDVREYFERLPDVAEEAAVLAILRTRLEKEAKKKAKAPKVRVATA